jgi:hypothetical protein
MIFGMYVVYESGDDHTIRDWLHAHPFTPLYHPISKLDRWPMGKTEKERQLAESYDCEKAWPSLIIQSSLGFGGGGGRVWGC